MLECDPPIKISKTVTPLENCFLLLTLRRIFEFPSKLDALYVDPPKLQIRVVTRAAGSDGKTLMNAQVSPYVSNDDTFALRIKPPFLILSRSASPAIMCLRALIVRCQNGVAMIALGRRRRRARKKEKRADFHHTCRLPNRHPITIAVYKVHPVGGAWLDRAKNSQSGRSYYSAHARPNERAGANGKRD